MTVWTNGCFDCIHSGHIEMLEFARNQGDRLIVGIDTDDRVRASKGAKRPIHSVEQRKRVLSSIRFVDEVVTFSSDDELVNRIRESNAKLIVVGSDYAGRRVIGSEIAAVKFFERVPNLSTTRIIDEDSF